MLETIITSLIAGLSVAIPSITATITANRRNQELMSFQIKQINADIKELKDNVVKMYDLEKRISILEEGAKHGNN